MAKDNDMNVSNSDSPYRGVSPWAVAVQYEFSKNKMQTLMTLPLYGMTCELKLGMQSLWLVAKWPIGGGVAFRTAFSPEHQLQLRETKQDETSIECKLEFPSGVFDVIVKVPDPDKPLLDFLVKMTPNCELTIPFWPSDTYPLDENGDPLNTNGSVHAAQRGPAMGFIYSSLTKPRSGSFFYLQDLTSLNDFCEQIHTAPDTRVGGSWPELGYTPPLAEREPLIAGQEVVISDAYIYFSPSIPENTGDLAQMFFDFLAEIYTCIKKPVAVYQDWIGLAERSVKDMQHKDCITEHNGLKYLCAYVGTNDRRPESMVQLSVLAPLLEYENWSKKKIPFTEELLKTLPTFYDNEIKCVGRYPVDMKDQEGEDVDEKGPFEIDSWYLYHPLVNLSRLALRGHKDAEKLLMDSKDYAISAAKHFNYKWPIMFDGRSFKVIRTAPTEELGETDVAGLYAYLMLQLHALTDDRAYITEAEKAVEQLKELHFNTGYQFNNTAWAANALVKLWKITQQDDYLHLRYMCLASIFHNCMMWDCNYGYAKHYSTFMGITPLREGAYIAAYEEMEMYAAFLEYLSLVESNVSTSIRSILAEYCKYSSDGKICAFPMFLPEDIIGEPRNGHINRKLAVPLEDISQGWDQPGKVGQEVYGAGIAPGIVSRCVINSEKLPFMIYSQYPVTKLEVFEDEKYCDFSIVGTPMYKAALRIIPDKKRASKENIDHNLSISDSGEKIAGVSTKEGHIEYEVPGGSKLKLFWM